MNNKIDELSSSNITLDQKVKDKRLYEVGDKTRIGDEISLIYASSITFIIYCGKSGSLAWEIEKIPNWAEDAIPQCRRLLGIAVSNLSKKHFPRVNWLLATSLANSITSPEGTNISATFENAERYIEKYRDEILSTIAFGPDFEIYRAKNGTIQWFHRKLPAHLNEAVEEFESLQSLSSSVLPKSYRPAISRMLGASLSIAFRKSEKEDLKETFKGARQFIFSQTDAYLKIKLFITSFIATIISLLALLGIMFSYEVNNTYLFGAGAGVVGAMVSALQRNNEIIIEPYGSILGLYSESLSRLIIGITFGVFVVFCSKSELALAPFKDNLYAITCFAFIAGFSERFVPDLMSTVTKKSEGGKS